MGKNYQVFLSLLLVLAVVGWTFTGSRPQAKKGSEASPDLFSAERAFSHVEAMAQEPHFLGSPAHSGVRNYLVTQLEELGLVVQTQEAYSLTKEGVLTRPQNILARIEGSGEGKALLLLSHYDSAMHSSFGASDAASGVATILEAVRAFQLQPDRPKNDIIILFTDSEELGLNGADIFVEEHPWAADVGLALNFEARGSGGDSFMLLETNGGNKNLLQHFRKAQVSHPVSNSLVYSVYKMLPNDTDLTVLREQVGIPGYNFAFIDDHFHYHTALDIPANLEKSTLAHQGSYLMPLLDYFSQVSLEELEADNDVVFFTIPGVGLVSYPFSWISPMLWLAFLFFAGVVGFGLMTHKIHFSGILKGFLPLLICLLSAGFIGYGLWELLLFMYPEYAEMEHGFPYNGYHYIYGMIFLVVGICFYSYHAFREKTRFSEFFVAPVLVWVVINFLAASYLKGAAYFVIPLFFSVVQLLLLILNPAYRILWISVLSIPVLIILLPFLVMFPVALGLKVLFLTAVLGVLLWTLLLPLFSSFKKKQLAGFLSVLTFFVFFILAHFTSDFNEERPKPNSLVYVLDTSLNQASWNTYDQILDPYTRPYFSQSERPPESISLSSKYNSSFTRSAVAPVISLAEPYVEVERLPDSQKGMEAYRLKIAPNREMNRLDLYTEEKVDFESFTVQGKEAPALQPDQSNLHIFKNRWSNRLLTYFATNRDTVRIQFSIKAERHPKFILYEASYDLHENKDLKVKPRSQDMIPRPFVLNDAIIIRKSFGPDDN